MGRFSPKIARTFPFAEIVQAYQYMESNAQVGKVVMTVTVPIVRQEVLTWEGQQLLFDPSR